MPLNKGYLTAKTNKESDEVYTPEYAVRPLLKYLDNSLTVWCPFDKEDSQYVKVFKEHGNKVIFSHIDEEKNFFYYEPESYDIIISNPPFSIKDDFKKAMGIRQAIRHFITRSSSTRTNKISLYKRWTSIFRF